MVKSQSGFQCAECGYQTAKWLGKCPECGSWNTLEETGPPVKAVKTNIKSLVVPLGDVQSCVTERRSTGFFELDRVLGGGVVPGSVVLAGGEPGIGKSTLFLKVMDHLAADGKSVLYVTGEESRAQIRMRADRLEMTSHNIQLLAETDMETVMANAESVKPDCIVIDSIQTMYDSRVSGLPGSVGQIRECSLSLTRYAKQNGCTVFIIGHVTKEGTIAGPRVLEHIVDTVLYFEGEKHGTLRILRAVKNRFGSTNEIGIFEMKQTGMAEVLNPSGILLGEMNPKTSGACVYCALEGTRPVLIEIQALVSMSSLAVPRRVATGADYNRVNMIVAVLEKKLGLKLYNQDIYVNIAGGMKLAEPAADLAIAVAIVSSFRSKPCDIHSVIFGEIGLTGEVRSVSMPEKRLNEAKKLGFNRVVLPLQNIMKDVKISQEGVSDIWQALDILIK